MHHLNFLPFMMAGMLFGWRGAVKAMIFGILVEAPIIVRHWARWPIDASDQLLELAIFGSAGIIAGLLADRERVQRLRVESTKRELENVYTELRENVEKMKRTERLSAAGQLAASLAHEIRNPLASISGAAMPRLTISRSASESLRRNRSGSISCSPTSSTLRAPACPGISASTPAPWCSPSRSWFATPLFGNRLPSSMTCRLISPWWTATRSR